MQIGSYYRKLFECGMELLSGTHIGRRSSSSRPTLEYYKYICISKQQ